MKIIKKYQSFAKTSKNEELINTEIKAESMKDAKEWFRKNTFEHEKIFLKK